MIKRIKKDIENQGKRKNKRLTPTKSKILKGNAALLFVQTLF
ncbi:hypothetical protein [Heyndrickxia sporothermodurans]|uniref:Uncharacterized protein n=1 Tax=Heyndrickxia sporothermodurans TaxID=46224 RepID=A0A150LDJ4_9BACI|nr:hypothetical protein [Heyndrickxia sporothermodurans]KYD10411.1 hypothetical protein B4102_2346 [Heyndrickxia sporothermodurans]